MITEKEIVDKLAENVSERINSFIREQLSEIVQQEISTALAKAIGEGHYYRSLSDDVINSVTNIYSEIRSVKKSLLVDFSDKSLDLLNESDSILDGIVKFTEETTLKILDYLEQIQDEIKAVEGVFDSGSVSSPKEKFDHLNQLILNTMTELSFQDLTGQQIRRVVQLLKSMEVMIFDAYMTSEIFKKSKERSPEKDIYEIRERAKDIIQNVKNKDTVIDQDQVDSILDQLGS